jgi:hypothetical protein
VRSAWRSRAWVLAGLALLLLVNIGILVSYRAFYDVQFQNLLETRRLLEKRRDEARVAAEKVRDSEARLIRLRDGLERFFTETLGSRRDRLAPLIEDVYTITKKANLRPLSIQYAEAESVGNERISMSFGVEGTYLDIKRLLAAFESNPQFLILESVAVSSDDQAPDVVKVALIVAHYFRSEGKATPGSSGRAPRPSKVSSASPSRAPAAGRTR